MGATRYNLHVDSHCGTVAISNAKPFEQTPHRAPVWNAAFFAVNVDFDHRQQLM
jgi:hypothetical protein